ncbi:3-hydroxyisobutyrate dehydrogenase, mitochondrial 1 [Phlyctema vagabunda]|uniref:3-hydroxyisobutyrate dehydrogenase, mitochondrial 1 n=1 Tax=Phlyctema vagabunda TaxID=108571 RepID=A0ABR4PDM7_9HELO
MESQGRPRLGWIGLGNMGLAMSMNLQKKLAKEGETPLSYTNRTMSRGTPLEALGGKPYDSIGGVVKNSDIIFISISDDKVLESISAEIIASGSIGGKIVVDTSTVHPDTSVAVSIDISNAGARFIASPVFGATPVAEKGQLLFAMAGPRDAVETITPYVRGTLARAVIPLGESVVNAGTLKTIGNFITAGMAELISEAHVLAEKTGLGAGVLESLIEENYGTYAYSISSRITSGAYAPPEGQKPMSDLNLAIKDVGHGITCGQNVGVKLEVAEVALNHLREAKKFSESQSDRPLDSSSMYGILRQNAGLDFESDIVKGRSADTK